VATRQPTYTAGMRNAVLAMVGLFVLLAVFILVWAGTAAQM